MSQWSHKEAIIERFQDVFNVEDSQAGLESFEVDTFIRSGEKSIKEIEGYGNEIREAIAKLKIL